MTPEAARLVWLTQRAIPACLKRLHAYQAEAHRIALTEALARARAEGVEPWPARRPRRVTRRHRPL